MGENMHRLAARLGTMRILNEFVLQAPYEQVRKTRQQIELAHLVGLMISAPTSSLFNLVSRRIRRSKMGITNANVFPEPVTASTTTSLCFMKRGIVDAWTGVICVWPIDCITSNLQGECYSSEVGGELQLGETYTQEVRGVGSEFQEPANAVEPDMATKHNREGKVTVDSS